MLKLLGEGSYGYVYKLKIANKYYLCKIIKDNNNIKNIINFNDKNEEKTHFLTLKSYTLLNNCDFNKLKDTNKIQDIINSKLKTKCNILIYDEILDGDLGDIEEHILNNDLLFINLLYQIVSAINIMKKINYKHNDLHLKNIMYKKVSKNNYKWYIIDYDMVTNINKTKSVYIQQVDILFFIYNLYLKKITKYDKNIDYNKYLPNNFNVTPKTFIYNLIFKILNLNSSIKEILLFIIKNSLNKDYDVILEKIIEYSNNNNIKLYYDVKKL